MKDSSGRLQNASGSTISSSPSVPVSTSSTADGQPADVGDAAQGVEVPITSHSLRRGSRSAPPGRAGLGELHIQQHRDGKRREEAPHEGPQLFEPGQRKQAPVRNRPRTGSSSTGRFYGATTVRFHHGALF